MTRPKATTEADWKRNVMRDQAINTRRGRGSDLAQNGSLRDATLDPDYTGPGPARVLFDGYPALSDEAYEWLRPYQPASSRAVSLMRANGTYKILAQSGERGRGGWESVPLQSNWKGYAITQADEQWADRVRSTLLPSGIVVLDGIVGGGTVAADTIVGVLPVGHRPDYDMMFPVNNGDIARAIKVLANGNIVLSSGSYTSNYFSLAGIAFPAAGVATWTTITTFVNSWVDFGVAAWGPPRYWVDPDGTIWFGGLVKGGTATSEAVIFVLPVGARPHREEHCVAASNEGFGAIGGDTGTGNVVVKSASNVWLSLCGVVMHTTAAYNLAWKPLFYVNSWVAHPDSGTLFPTPGYLRRWDGLCMTRGLMVSGTLGATAFQMPEEFRTSRHVLIAGVANNARARIDLNGARFAPQQGSNVWFSLDSIKWYPG